MTIFPFVFFAAVVFMLILMPRFLPYLKKMKFGQTIYDLGPRTHMLKQGTPNMGGILIGGVSVFVSLTAAFFLSEDVWGLNSGLWALLFVCLGSMFIGFLDDYVKDIKKRHDGLKPYQKIVGQVTVGLLFSVYCYHYVESEVIVPFTKSTWNLGLLYIPLMTLLVVFMTNSANLQDGVDGLLSSVTLIGMTAWGILAEILIKVNMPAGISTRFVSVLCFSLVGSCAGFLHYNRHPADIFMGDTGSMFIGGAMVGAAMLLKCEFLLIPICFTCIMSSVSVMMQVLYFKYSHGKRIFKMAPIHHHFELCGMSENKIVLMYLAVTVLLSVVAVLSITGWI